LGRFAIHHQAHRVVERRWFPQGDFGCKWNVGGNKTRTVPTIAGLGWSTKMMVDGEVVDDEHIVVVSWMK
jgi:hypothetical protein